MSQEMENLVYTIERLTEVVRELNENVRKISTTVDAAAQTYIDYRKRCDRPLPNRPPPIAPGPNVAEEERPACPFCHRTMFFHPKQSAWLCINTPRCSYTLKFGS